MEARAEASVAHLHPDGNAEGWGGLQWLYFPEGRYNEVRGTVARAITAAKCRKAIVHGFSNGASAAASLYCHGERFGGVVIGYILDDPVTDHAVERCRPAEGTRLVVYWTGALDHAGDGWDCAPSDWTCEGGTTIGLTRYVRALGVTATPSPHREHRIYASPPEYGTWW